MTHKSYYLVFNILFFILYLTSNVNAEIEYAWWVTAEFEPQATKIEGMPVSKIDTSWENAEVLNWDGFPKGLVNKSEINKNEIYFSFEGDFDNDGKIEKALVGVYSAKNQEMGRFLLILKKSKSGRWKKVFLEKYSGSPGFIVLSYDGKNLGLCMCLECDDCASIKWNGKKYILEWDDV